MGLMKAALGTPLKDSELVDDHHRAKLEALSVTTVEDLYGLISADTENVANFLEIHDVAQLTADIGRDHPSTMAVLSSAEQRLSSHKLALGAQPPSADRAEPQATYETFSKYSAGDDEAVGPEGVAVDLRSQVRPVRAQGDRGTCVAHAVGALTESIDLTRGGADVDLSPQYLYYHCKQIDGFEGEGTWIRHAVPLVDTEGVCTEAMWPYDPDIIEGDLTHGEPPPAASQDAGNHRHAAPEQIDERSSAAIRDVLDSDRVVALSIPVYRSWHQNSSVEEFGLIPMPLPGSAATGGHAMCAVGYGYDPDFTGGGFFILKNSWGTDWALNSPIEPGYGLLPFEYVDQYGWEAWSIITQ